jgi:hypothetical protein
MPSCFFFHAGQGNEPVPLWQIGSAPFSSFAPGPQQLLARLGYPFARRLQRRFARDSAAAMRRVFAEGQSAAQAKSDFSPG